MKAISLFAGVGGIDLAFSQAGVEIIWANDLDYNACVTYRGNFDSEIINEDIKKISANLIPNFDILLAGFPCQAFSVAGYRKGFDDERGSLFFEIIRIIREKKPSVVFLENVKNLVGHNNGITFNTILDNLKEQGYKVKYQVMNACTHGNIPQNRERIYIVGFLDEEMARNFDFPEPIRLTNTIENIIDFTNKKDNKYYYIAEKCKFYSILEKDVNEIGVIYQWRRKYVRKNKSMVCPTLTANMGTGGHNVPIILTPFGIRKLTPRECFSLQGFPMNYTLPKILSATSLYKQAGNSVVVPVIARIAKNIVEAFEMELEAVI